MPIYEYACKSCGFEKDCLQKLSDAPLTVCPECNEEAFVKKISAPGFRLKGGGWYETDFKTGKKKNLVESGQDNKKQDDKKKETSSGETKKTDSKKSSTDSAA